MDDLRVDGCATLDLLDQAGNEPVEPIYERVPPVVYDAAGARQRAGRRAVERNLGAEVRAVEEGHRCRLDAARGLFLVKSDTSGRTYELGAKAYDDLVAIHCTCPAGVKRHVPAGQTVCKHAALVARRLEREGLVRFDGRLWRTVGGEPS